MIKNKFNFFIGVFCGMCFVIGIILKRDVFALMFMLFSTVVNISFGLFG